VDGRADLYALGCVGYFLLTGSLVFDGENALQLVVKHLQAEPVPPSVRLGRPVPAELERAIMSCLAKAPDARPADATVLVEALTCAGANDWTQVDARSWWETTFSPAPSDPADRAAPPSAFLEVAR
jgi:serine/threonine-protein kinase